MDYFIKLFRTLTCLLILAGNCHADDISELDEILPFLGHRNWIVVTDSAYPLQSNPGIKTIVIEEDQLQVVKEVAELLKQQKHVSPIIHTDRELAYVKEANAPGIEAYRKSLADILNGRKVQTILHERIIARLDEAAKTFRVVIIKTTGTLPYTSVFFELDCAYWNEQAEQELRNDMGGKQQ